jgi:hypothetical protein
MGHALHKAAEKGYLRIVALVVERGAHTDLQDAQR